MIANGAFGRPLIRTGANRQLSRMGKGDGRGYTGVARRAARGNRRSTIGFRHSKETRSRLPNFLAVAF